MPFVERQLVARFSLANGQFEGGGNGAEVSGLRMTCEIQATGGAAQSVMHLSIYGMSPSLMNQLSTVGNQYNQRTFNGIDVLAGDAIDGLSLVFTGVIFNAFIDGNDQPDVCFRIVASPGAYLAVKPSAPVSIKGSADAADMMSNLAGEMGLAFENNGVNAKLANPYYAGTAWGRALNIADHANFDMVVERGVLAISPRGTPRQGDAVLISPQTGMVGYPAFVENSVIAKALFNPNIKLWGSIAIESSLTAAQGTWQVRKIDYELDCLVQSGRWFNTLECIPVGTQ